jgi:hypothetical protein
MDFQSQPGDTEGVITLPDKADEAILSDPWPQDMAQPSIRGAGGFVLVAYPYITQIFEFCPLGRSFARKSDIQ